MKGSIRFTLLMLGMIAMVACGFDSGDTKTDRGVIDIVLSQDSPVSVNLGTAEVDFSFCSFGSKGILAYSNPSFETEKFYAISHESNDLFELTIGDLSAMQFG